MRARTFIIYYQLVTYMLEVNESCHAPDSGAQFNRCTELVHEEIVLRNALKNRRARLCRTMQNPRFFDEISARVSEALANSPAKDLEKNLRANLSGFFSKLDLVTREEFDIQVKVLERTREKLTRLEAQLAELEKTLKP